LFLIFSVAASAQKRSITEKDMFDFAWIGDPQVSPDGSAVAFVKVTVNPAKTNYDTSIWTVSTNGNEEPRRLTSGTRDSSPRWSPDGKYLAFVRGSETPGPAGSPQIYILPMTGGEAFQLTNVARGAGGPTWSPDGKWIAFGSGANPEDLAKQGKPPALDTRESDVRVITRAVYRSDGGGYNDPTRPNHLWVIAAPNAPGVKATAKQLTNGQFSEGNFVWSGDSGRIFYATNRNPEPYYSSPQTEIYSVPVGGGPLTLLTNIPMGVGAMSLSPDGKRFAFNASVASEPVKSYTQPDLWVMEVAQNAKPKNLTAGFDFDIGAGLTGDQGAPRAGGGNAPIWTADGKSIIERFTREGRANLGLFDAENGRLTELTKGDQSIDELSCYQRSFETRLYSLDANTHKRPLYLGPKRRQPETTDTHQ
jgi:dipeptidyl aminopeptidase/acylaminoacyl peptidase